MLGTVLLEDLFRLINMEVGEMKGIQGPFNFPPICALFIFGKPSRSD